MTTVRFIVILIVCTFCLGCSNATKFPANQFLLDTNGPVSIDVESFAGDVNITADKACLGTSVSVVKKTKQGTFLDSINCNIFARNTEIGEEVVVQISTEKDELRYMRANISIITKSVDNVRIKTRSGNVTLLGVSGSLDVHTTDGDVLVATTVPITDSVSIENHRGNIVFLAPEESTGTIDLSAIGGRTSLDILAGNATVLPGSTKGHMMAIVNGGRNNIALRTVDGNAIFEILKNPMAYRGFWDFDWLSF